MHSFSVSFALLLYDEFDGSAIADANILFRHEGRIVTPLRKREGFYVFRDVNCPVAELEISRPHYHKKTVRILKSRLDPGNPVKRVRLTREYSEIFSDCQWMDGSCPPDSEVMVFAEEAQLKLQVGDAEKNRLTILGCAASRLLGRRFTVDKKSGETFLVIQMLAPGVYLADKELAAPPKGTWPVIRAYLSRSGSDGHYHVPVEHGHSGKIAGTAYYDGGKEQWVYALQAARS